MFSAIRPVYSASAWRISIGLLLSGLPKVSIYDDGAGTPAVLKLNNGISLQAGTIYTFVFGVTKSASYSVRLNEANTVSYLLVEEVAAGVI